MIDELYFQQLFVIPSKNLH